MLYFTDIEPRYGPRAFGRLVAKRIVATQWRRNTKCVMRAHPCHENACLIFLMHLRM